MFQDAFVKLDNKEIVEILGVVNPILGDDAFAPSDTTILAQSLSFYPGYRFLEISDHNITPPRQRFAISKPSHIEMINWTNEPIYRLNAKVPLTLDENTISAYIKFFFSYVRGRHGRFIIVESLEEIPWREEPPIAARKALGPLIEPVRITGRDPDGTYHLEARMIFKDSLFKSKAKILPQGLVTLFDEELLVENMPVLQDTLG